MLLCKSLLILNAIWIFGDYYLALDSEEKQRIFGKIFAQIFFVFDEIDVSAFGEHSVFTFHHKNARELICFDSFIFQKKAPLSLLHFGDKCNLYI